MTYSQNFQTVAVAVSATTVPAGPHSRTMTDKSIADVPFLVEYTNPPSYYPTYTLSVNGASQTFVPGDNQTSRGSWSAESTWVKNSSLDSVQDRLVVVLGNSVRGIRASYSLMGGWRRIFTNGATTRNDDWLFVFGLPTAPASVPITGASLYRGHVVMVYFQGGQPPTDGDIDGPLVGSFTTFTFDFAAGTVSVYAELIGGVYTGTGRIDAASGTFSVSLTGARPDSNYTGTLTGNFYGPNATEFGGRIRMQNPAGDTAAGVFNGSNYRS
jgi:hypothetical protein